MTCPIPYLSTSCIEKALIPYFFRIDFSGASRSATKQECHKPDFKDEHPFFDLTSESNVNDSVRRQTWLEPPQRLNISSDAKQKTDGTPVEISRKSGFGCVDVLSKDAKQAAVIELRTRPSKRPALVDYTRHERRPRQQ